jgi:hypothetical protein
MIVSNWKDSYDGPIANMDIHMGSLEPGATYIYERVDNRIYARKFGETKRQMVGWTDKNDTGLAMQGYRSEINQVLTMCETDPAMKELLDQLFVLYNLKKTHE